MVCGHGVWNEFVLRCTYLYSTKTSTTATPNLARPDKIAKPCTADSSNELLRKNGLLRNVIRRIAQATVQTCNGFSLRICNCFAPPAFPRPPLAFHDRKKYCANRTTTTSGDVVSFTESNNIEDCEKFWRSHCWAYFEWLRYWALPNKVSRSGRSEPKRSIVSGLCVVLTSVRSSSTKEQ